MLFQHPIIHNRWTRTAWALVSLLCVNARLYNATAEWAEYVYFQPPIIQLDGANSATVYSIAWSPDGERIAFGGGRMGIADVSPTEFSIRIVDVKSGTLLATLTGNRNIVRSLDWSPSGDRIVTADITGSMKLWNTTTGQIEFDTGEIPYGRAVAAWSPVGNRVASALRFAYLEIWDVDTRQIVVQLQDGLVSAVDWSPDGQRLVVGMDNGEVWIVDAATGRTLLTLLSHTGGVWAVAWHPDGTRVASGGEDGFVRIWNAQTGTALSALQIDQVIQDLSWSRAMNEFTVADRMGRVLLWDEVSAQPIQAFQSPYTLLDLDYSPYGGRLALAGGISPQVEAAYAQAGESLSPVVSPSFGERAVQIVVPAPSLERLSSIAALCNAPQVVTRTLPAATDADARFDSTAFIAQLDALPADALPPGCAADLRAVAEALAGES